MQGLQKLLLVVALFFYAKGNNFICKCTYAYMCICKYVHTYKYIPILKVKFEKHCSKWLSQYTCLASDED